MTENLHDNDERRLDLLTGQALGILDGRERSMVLAHLETCDTCARDLAQLTMVADRVLMASPDAEPPMGFESRVMASINEASETRGLRRTSPRWLTAVAAVMVALALGVGVVVATTSNPSPVRASTRTLTGSLVSNHQVVGSIYAFSGSPNWMVVSLAPHTPPLVVRCVVDTTSSTHYLGSFALKEPVSTWSVPLPVALAQVRSVTLSTSSGTVIARSSWLTWQHSGRNYPISPVA